jgi:hypothetical protein
MLYVRLNGELIQLECSMAPFVVKRYIQNKSCIGCRRKRSSCRVLKKLIAKPAGNYEQACRQSVSFNTHGVTLTLRREPDICQWV